MDPHFHWHSSHSVCVSSCVSSRVSLTCIPVRIPVCNCMRILLVSCEYMLTVPSRCTSISHSKVPQQRKYTTSFIPLVYLFCKQHETDGACLMMMEALNLISVKYYNQPLQPGATCSDHSDAFRKAYLVRILLVFEYVSLLLPLSYPCCILFVTMYVSLHVSLQTTWPTAVFLQCWPHIARKVAEGQYWSTSWPHHAEAVEHIRAIHLSQTLPMRDMLIEKAGVIWDSWDKKTMITFWNSHCIEPWDNWTMASCIDVPLCTPSQNTQESWHNNILIGKIPQMFGGSTEHVLAVAMPQLVKMDGYLLPDELSFDVIERSYSNAYATRILTHIYTVYVCVSFCCAPCRFPSCTSTG